MEANIKSKNRQQLCGASPEHGRGFVAVLVMHLFPSFTSMVWGSQ